MSYLNKGLFMLTPSPAGTDDDLEYYVRECGDILGISMKLPADSRDAKHILEHVFTQVVEFKKLNQVSSSTGKFPFRWDVG